MDLQVTCSSNEVIDVEGPVCGEPATAMILAPDDHIISAAYTGFAMCDKHIDDNVKLVRDSNPELPIFVTHLMEAAT